ncbi:5-formyltetrahydrofolate cyclo-ligase [Vampirovibrio sp.]|uniref:5-formyltetrahydrofolate cyclo-ligase n=1 Tax=Vampirovibrio sp. TaxID=2717857 RepID=UPI003593C4AC
MSDSPISDASKQTLRKQALALRATLPMASLSALICQKIATHPAIIKASRVLFYYPLRTEPDLRALANQFPDKNWFLPVMKSGQGMRFYPYQPQKPLRPGKHGILEPEASEEAAAIGPEHLQADDVMILPGLLFDQSGYRLGYGQGNFDRFLGQAHEQGQTCVTIGAVPSDLLWENLPVEGWDLPVDWLITEHHIWSAHAEREGSSNFDG